MGVRDAVQRALDEAFCDGVKVLYGAAIAKVAGGESIDEAIREFNAGIVLEVAKLHARVLAEADAVMTKNGIT